MTESLDHNKEKNCDERKIQTRKNANTRKVYVRSNFVHILIHCSCVFYACANSKRTDKGEGGCTIDML